MIQQFDPLALADAYIIIAISELTHQLWQISKDSEQMYFYGSRGGFEAPFLSCIALKAPPIMLPPFCSSLHTFPKAAFILNFEGSPA
jgi:hypothetical protein